MRHDCFTRLPALLALLLMTPLTGCVTISKPANGTTVNSSTIQPQISFPVGAQLATFQALLDGQDVTASFTVRVGCAFGVLQGLTLGSHKLQASIVESDGMRRG